MWRALPWLLWAACSSSGAAEFLPVDELPERESPPPALVSEDGQAIDSPELWRDTRRPEIRALFEHYVYGTAPPAPSSIESELLHEVTDIGDGVRYREFEIRYGGPAPIYVALFSPAESTQATPVFLAVNPCGNHSLTTASEVRRTSTWMEIGCADDGSVRGSRDERWPLATIVEAGYTLATFHQSDLAPDDSRNDEDGVIPFYPPNADAPWGVIRAWTWGARRVVDFLVTESSVDSSRIITVGHSRRGKVALLAAALDERIAAAIPHQSGTAGATLSRSFLGESVAAITLFFPHWFTPVFEEFGDREARLPIDQHLLLAMVAPRPLLVTNGEDDDWADPPGALRAVELADEVYELLGSEGATVVGDTAAFDADLSWHTRPGGHDLLAEDWTTFIDYANARIR